MFLVDQYIQENVFVAWISIIIAFVFLFKSSDVFVDRAVSLAARFNVPRMVIGIVLVSIATTAPELSVSMMAALRGSPEMALGNAIGSVICDDGLALGLAGVVASAPVAIIPSVFRGSAWFLIIISLVICAFVVFDHTLSGWEGMILVVMFVCYLGYLFRQRGEKDTSQELQVDDGHEPLVKIFVFFLLALLVIIVSSEFVVTSATVIARSFNISEAVIALTLVAFGTSVPEVATCITAARKGQGAIAVGNILGADIMNICWVAGASSIVNDLTISGEDMWFMFPSMLVVVFTMLLMLSRGYRLTRGKGLVLLGLYFLYIAGFFAYEHVF